MVTRRDLLKGCVLMAAAGPYRLRVNTRERLGPCDPALWSNIGYDPFYGATVAEQAQPFWQMNAETKPLRYIRCHNMFSDAAPNARPDRIFGCRVFRLDANGKPVYNWQYLDQVLDIWTKSGLKPILETDFMPDAVVEGEIVRNYSGGAINTPRDYPMWRDLVYETVKHVEQRYGAGEVRTWYFEIWNEPDLRTYFIDGQTGQQGPFSAERLARFNKMYDYFVDGALAADPKVRVGGPGIAGHQDFLRTFLTHVVESGKRIDFISWHCYGTIEQMRNKNRSMKGIIEREFPSLKRAELHHTEWGQRLGLDSNRASCYTEYEAAFLCRMIDVTVNDPTARVGRLLRWGQPVSSWRTLTREEGGKLVRTPVYNAYDLLSRLSGEWVSVSGADLEGQVRAFAARSSSGQVHAVVYHFHEPNQQGTGPAAHVTLAIEGLKGKPPITHYRIDHDHPQPQRLDVPGGIAEVEFDLPVNAVSFLTFG